MKRTLSTAALFLGSVLPLLAAAQAATPAPAAAPAPSAAGTDAPSLVCRSEKPKGTRVSTRVCRTQEEWDAIKAGSKEYTKTGQNHLQDVKPPGGG